MGAICGKTDWRKIAIPVPQDLEGFQDCGQLALWQSLETIKLADKKDMRNPRLNHATFEDYKVMRPYKLKIPKRQFRDKDKIRTGTNDKQRQRKKDTKQLLT